MADKTYRIGIIGCGGMGRSHARNWTSTGRAEVVTASDISAESAAKFAEEHSLPTHYTDFGEMCEKEDFRHCQHYHMAERPCGTDDRRC